MPLAAPLGAAAMDQANGTRDLGATLDLREGGVGTNSAAVLFPFLDRGLVPKPGTRIVRKIETAHPHEAAQMSE